MSHTKNVHIIYKFIKNVEYYTVKIMLIQSEERDANIVMKKQELQIKYCLTLWNKTAYFVMRFLISPASTEGSLCWCFS